VGGVVKRIFTTPITQIHTYKKYTLLFKPTKTCLTTDNLYGQEKRGSSFFFSIKRIVIYTCRDKIIQEKNHSGVYFNHSFVYINNHRLKQKTSKKLNKTFWTFFVCDILAFTSYQSQ